MPRHKWEDIRRVTTVDHIATIRRCLLALEYELGITTDRARRERALIREARDALRQIEGGR